MPNRVSRRSLAHLLSGLVGMSVLGAPARGADADHAEPIVVFAAASLKTALDAIGAAWTAAGGSKVTFVHAASGALVRQIENGAPADVLVCADQAWMDYATEKALIAPESRVALVGNALVLVARTDQTIDVKIGPGFKLADAIGDSRLATGEPRAVPLGAYAKAALASLGVWDAVAGRIAGADNARVALAFVARGEARLGIVYQSDAAAEPKVRVVDRFPAASHPPIIYPAALTARTKSAAAQAFLRFLRSDAARQVFVAQGFTTLP